MCGKRWWEAESCCGLILRFFGFLFSWVAIGSIMALAVLAAVFAIYGKDLPDYAQLESYEPPTLSRIYSGEGALMDEFARERRIFTPIDEIPDRVKQAFISAEDKNFYAHHGFDPRGIVAALYDAAVHGERLRGASTITQQVMKNFLLTGDRSGERKIKEIILATRLENTLSKDEILELYLNEIFLGQNSYGVTAAAQVYFAKSLDELTLAETAYLAALPQAPSVLHPVREKPRAIARRNYVLDQMARERLHHPRRGRGGQGRGPADGAERRHRVGAQRDAAARLFHRRDPPPALGEARRRGALHRRPDHPRDRRSRPAGRWRRRRCATGWRTTTAACASIAGRWRRSTRRASIRPTRRAGGGRSARPQVPRDIDGWHPAVILSLGESSAPDRHRGRRRRTPDGHFLSFEDASWARVRASDSGRLRARAGAGRHLGRRRRRAASRRSRQDGGFDRWSYRQIPAIQGGFMAMDTQTGRVLAMQGGFSYQSSVFNRATQALRQPGSSFKPFVYAAALDNGYSPATIVLDAPIEVATGAGIWEPENSGNTYYGPTPMRTGIEQSRNLMTVRIAQDVGMDVVAQYGERFGIYDDMPPLLSYSLGAGETTLYKMVAAYAMFANGGLRVEPTLVDRVQDRYGKTIYRHDQRACEGCAADDIADAGQPLIHSERRADHGRDHRLPDDLDAAGRGQPRHQRRARVGKLHLNLAGKTGTTNEAKDVWYIGYSPRIVAGCYMGYDTPRPLGESAFGGTLCAPIFVEFIKAAMAGQGPVKLAGAAGRPLHQDRPPHRPAAAGRRRGRQRAGRVHPRRPGADGRRLRRDGGRRLEDGRGRAAVRERAQLAADRAGAGARPDPGAAEQPLARLDVERRAVLRWLEPRSARYSASASKRPARRRWKMP